MHGAGTDYPGIVQADVETLLSPIWKGDLAVCIQRLSLFHETAFFLWKHIMDIQPLLEKTASQHTHLCPRQILGIRLGLAGLKALDLEANNGTKRLLVILETDGCFADGVSAATGCTVGHRTLRVEDYGKVAATFVDVKSGRTVRVAPVLDIRERAYEYAPGESRHYFAQMQAYQVMPDDEMLIVTEVQLAVSVETIVSRPGIRVNCDMCGEEIMNEREVRHDGLTLCRSCAGDSYYQVPVCLPAKLTESNMVE
jgi:formylmethanofuran dehydrogenase subunit E